MGYYDSMLGLEKTAGLLYKQPLLDSIIHYKAYCNDSHLLNAFYNRGFDMDEEGLYYLAREDFENVLQLGSITPFVSFQQEFMTLNRLASIFNRLGDIRQSLLLRQRQLARSSKAGTPDHLATTYINLAILYDDTGRSDTALTLLHQALQLKDISIYSRAKLLCTLAAVQQKDAPAAALSTGYEALALLQRFEERGDTLYSMGSLYETLAAASRRMGSTSAEHLFHIALRKKIDYEGTERTREIGKTYLALADYYHEKQDTQQAIAALQKALYTVTDTDTADIYSLPLKKNLYAENTIMEALDAKAGWMLQHGRTTHAIQCFDLAFEVERKLLEHVAYDESKLMMLKESRTRSEKAVACCWQLYQQTGNPEWITKAWQFAEKSKGITLLHSIRQHLWDATLQRDSLYTQAQRLEEMLIRKENTLHQLLRNSPDDTAAIRFLQSEKTYFEQQLLDARRSLRQGNTTYRFLLAAEDSLDLRLAQQQLSRGNTTIIEYFVGDSSAYGFSLQDKTVKMIRLPANAGQQVETFLSFFSDSRRIVNDPAGYQRIAYEAYQNILLPLAGRPGNLIIVPDGRLNVLPFDAFLTKPANSTNLQTLPYLIKDYTIEWGYSIVSLLRQSAVARKEGHNVGFAPVSFRNASLQSLPFTKDELTALQETGSEGRYFLQEQSTLDCFRKQAPMASVIHIASHASSAEGSKPSIEFYDSTLYLNELYGMRLVAGLVVLSACESGIGTIEKGEGAMSLARGFYYAGAQQIVSTLWKVNDQSTARLLGNFYNLSGRKDHAHSLRDAKLLYLQNNKWTAKHSPFYWAGFVIIGHNEKPAKKWEIYMLSALASIVVVMGIAICRSRMKNRK